MQPLVLIIASIFIKAFSIWQRLQTSNNSNETKKDKQNSLNKVHKALCLANVFFNCNFKYSYSVEQIEEFDIGSIASEVLWAHIFGVLVMASPRFFILIGSQMLNFRTEDSLSIGFYMFTDLTLLWRFYLRR